MPVKIKWRKYDVNKKMAYVSEGVHIFTKSFNIVLSDKVLCSRLDRHAKGKIHIRACEKLVEESDQNSKLENDEIEVKVEMHEKLEEGEENETINIEIKNKIDKKTRLKIPPDVLEYLETRLMKKHTWMEIWDGKLFCQVKMPFF